MKIAIIRQRYNPHGGAERFVSRALSALAKQQAVTLHLIARAWEPIDGIRFHRCNPFYLERMTRDMGFAYRACQTAQSIGADLIQSHERLCCCDLYRAGDGVHREWIKQKNRYQPWFKRWAMRLNPYHVYVQLAERRMFESARLQAVICNSNMVKNEILHYFRIDARKIHVIYNGVDTGLFHPALKQQRQELRAQWAIPGDAPVFLFVGSGFERKGLQQAIDAFAALPESAYLLVVGYDKHAQRYRDAVVKRGLERRVRFFGAQQDVKPFYALADAFVQPTLYDPFPNAVLEAMACGLPVITGSKAGIAELLTDGESGYVCAAHDIAKINAAMRALSDTTHAETMGGKARQIAERYEWAVIGDSLVDLYQTLLDAKST
ncbi:MAG: glycosyltransferase family 4 protein [Gammaproteobacteria bacterium]